MTPWSAESIRKMVKAAADLALMPREQADAVRRELPARHGEIAADLLAQHARVPMLDAAAESFVHFIAQAESISIVEATKLTDLEPAQSAGKDWFAPLFARSRFRCGQCGSHGRPAL